MFRKRFPFTLLALSFFCCYWLIPGVIIAQNIVISGKVIDAETGDAVPFANVTFKSNGKGTNTDFEGTYRLEGTVQPDSLLVSYVGYVSKTKPIGTAPQQEINFQLNPDIISLQEVIFYAGENPAFELLRRVDQRRKQHDRSQLSAYEYESYTKVEIDVDHLPDKEKQGKLVRKITDKLDSLQQISGEDGKPIIPVFLSETISRTYYKTNPELHRENILKTKVSGVGLEADNWLSQVTGSTFQQYNFYQNWLNIVGKDFISPIASTGKVYYEYELSDSLLIGEDFCYRLDFFPKSEQDLAFRGTVWITKNEYALKQADVQISQKANLNYIEQIRIQQTMVKDSSGAWLPEKTRVLIDSEEFGNTPGLLAKFYSSNQDFVVNNLQESRFYETDVSMLENAYESDDSYWLQNRHEQLTDTELQLYDMIDTLNQIPVIKTYSTILDTFINGYKPVGNIDIGPYLYAYANNTIEGHRMRLGFRTNSGFSKKWTLRGYGAYGTQDQEWKYGAGVDFILSRTPWATVSVDHSHDLSQIGIYAEELQAENYIFYASSFFGDLDRAYMYDRTSVKLYRQLPFGLSSTVAFRHEWFDPLFDFAYLKDPSDALSIQDGRFTTSEIRLEARFARDEQFLQQGNRRLSLGTTRWPIFKARYIIGLEDVLGSDFNYQKMEGSISQRLKMGLLGTSTYEIEGGYTFDALPYPLLNIHLGNESSFYSTAGYSTMNRNEFISDHYVALHYKHSFQGFILNRIPVMKKLKWRLLATSNVLYGGIREENRKILAETDLNGNTIPTFTSLGNKPFVEVGYGIENIFRVVRVDAFHRLTYRDNPEASKFKVMVSFQFIF
ncbi:DUF5686 and carboxypeptidase-like regulatory domain-containing protein [Catalinimonas niigatensis]|uniref:DUF5686 and carboxypeptidase-like regulatory domain-containing protein n=1 Tax=Catalinimonas niigatensis TaxID=1397264 RepID=UPI0026666429|nr:DUF5686 and carboxypeptidase-like regulatory domain-containing protein [Catalinimonas niigatensis]WPP53393.1 DUF5686 family protein [Catalinimonas niigatensis]